MENKLDNAPPMLRYTRQYVLQYTELHGRYSARGSTGRERYGTDFPAGLACSNNSKKMGSGKLGNVVDVDGTKGEKRRRIGEKKKGEEEGKAKWERGS